MLSKEEIATIRENAASLIVHMGWFAIRGWDTQPTEGKYSTSLAGHECLFTAILQVSCEQYPAYSMERDIAPVLGFHNMGDAIRWNNAPERTMDEVVDRLLHFPAHQHRIQES